MTAAPPAAPRWPLPGELRMPLQIGNSALIEAAFASGAAINAAALALAYVPDGGDAEFVVAVVLLGVAALWLAVARTSLIGCRASDVVLGPRGFAVEGGPHDGLLLPWPAIDPGRCRVENDRVPDPDGAPLRGHQLVFGLKDGGDCLVAEAYQADDREALYVALDEARAVHGLPPLPEAERSTPSRADAAAPATEVRSADTLRCRHCGAAAEPKDMSHVTCPMCQRALPVPKKLRVRLAAEAALTAERARAAALLGRLLVQRGAASTNRRLAAVFAVLLALPLLGGLCLLGLVSRGQGDAGQCVGLWVCGAALASLVVVLTSPMLARRVALRACLVELGARRSDAAGPRCRSCGGELPEEGEAGKVLVRCPYCRCDNLLGVDLRPWQRAEQGRQRSLQQLLDERSARLRGVAGDALLCVVIAVAAGAWPVISYFGA